jgi:hypothetical protein
MRQQPGNYDMKLLAAGSCVAFVLLLPVWWVMMVGYRVRQLVADGSGSLQIW